MTVPTVSDAGAIKQMNDEAEGWLAQAMAGKLHRHNLWFLIDNKPRGALPRRHLCTFHILIPYYFVPYIMPLCHSTIPPFRHSAIPPFRHSTIPSFHHSAIPPFHSNMQ
jgi:hypothetical protein